MRITLQMLFSVLLFSLAGVWPLAAADVPGAQDHPLISRYPGSEIAWYDVQEFDRYQIATGPVSGYKKIDDWMPVEGKITRIYYTLTGTRSLTEVYLNFRNALKKGGFEIIVEGLHKDRNIAKDIGGRGWLGVYFGSNPFPIGAGIQLLDGSATVGGSGFVAGKLTRSDATVYVAITGTQYREDRVLFLIDVIEQKAMEDDRVFVNADAMLQGLQTEGKIALYGIFFDTGKADIKPESKATLDEIAALLGKQPDLRLYIVGHTDDTGELSLNVKLSHDRAAAVVKALVENYHIAGERLLSFGAGPYAPASTNLNGAGRQRNRRVELVQQLN